MGRRFKRTFRSGAGGARGSVDEELEHHIDLCADELVEAGWDPGEARREAVRRFGDLEETRAYCESMQARRARGEEVHMKLEELAQDLRFAARTLGRAPGYSALVVVTLGFGISANTTIFGVMNPYLFRPLPYGAPEQLVQVNAVNPVTGWDMDRFSYPQYEDWRARTRAFSDVAAYEYGSTNVTGDPGPEQIQFARVTANMFDVLDAPPLVGRGFVAEDGRPGAAPAVLLSEGLWARRYASDPALVGRTLLLDGVQHTVVGVMPPRFNFPFGGVKLWVPIQETATADRDRTNLQLIGRLTPGATAQSARAELASVHRELAAEYPESDGRMSGITVKPLREALNFAWDVLTLSFAVLLGAVGFVLLIACVNVASLTLARANTRAREVSVRAAMGAGRGRIVRQLLTESLLLSLLGGALGVGLTYWMTGLIDPLLPEDLYRIGAIEVDAPVLAFSLAVTLVTPVFFGLVPALDASRTDLVSGLKEGVRSSGGRGGSRGRRALVVAQVALAVVLITGAGLMLRSFMSVQALDLGFDADRVAVAEVVLPTNEYPSATERLGFVDEALREVRALPGVDAASAVTWLPLNHETIARQFAPPERAGTPVDEWPLAVFNYVLPHYFRTMGIALLEGRDFGAQDDAGGAPVVIVSRTLARQVWPNGSAVGQTLLVGEGSEPPTAYTVAGVVDDIRHQDLEHATSEERQLYRPALQAAARRYHVVARTDGEPASLVAPMRRALQGLAPNLPVPLRPMNDVVAENQLQWSLSTFFLAILGLGALLLATLGIYGLVSFSVAQRRREIGVRIALGASRGEIRRVVVGDGVRLTAMGLVAGVIAALLLARLVASILYGVGPFDPVTLAAVPVLFLCVAALASWVPAARASGTDPISVLRQE